MSVSARPAAHAPPIAIGALVAEKYRIESLLGEGGMGFVFAALHVLLGHRVALKVLHTSSISNKEVTERFLREGRALARLKGEHIARVSDVGTLPSGEPYFVMEFLEGRDLARELSARGPLPVAETVEYLAQACEALAEAHVRGIVHRDLKPANLFLSHKLGGDVSVKVLDFGISKVSDDGVSAMEAENITVTSTIVGTPKYMSPEQIQDSRSVDSRTDIWGLGTIFYELLTQKRAFAAESLALVCVKVLHEEIPPPSSIRAEIPPGIDAIIAQCLKKDPAARYANVGELVEALIPFGSPTVRSSATRITRILASRSSNARLAPDSSGSLPGVRGVSSVSVDSGQPMSRTPSAIDVHKEVATLTVGSPTFLEAPANKRRRNQVAVALGAVLTIGVIVFVALRSKSPAVAVPIAASTEVRPIPIPTPEPSQTATIAVVTTPSATASAPPSAKPHGFRPPITHATTTTTATTTTPHPTQSAVVVPPKGSGDVLEDRH